MIKTSTNKSANGTSFHGHEILTTYNELVKHFGEPTYVNGIEEKSQFDWVLEHEIGFVFTIYDWKEYKTIEPDDVISWHIGAHSEDASRVAHLAVTSTITQFMMLIHEPETDSAGFNKFDKADEIVAMLKNIDVDGETMEYIIRQVGMEEQMSRQLVYNKITETECDCGHCSL